MNLIDSFQDLVAQVPELIRPLIVALAGAVPFIEGEGAAAIGIVGGIAPVVAAVAAAVGNVVCVTIVVLISARTRDAVVAHHRRRRAAQLVAPDGARETDAAETAIDDEPASPRKARFQRAFERYGVPGVSLLGPLLLPTQFTAAMLAAAGVGRVRILAWQAVAIAGWTTLVTLILTGVIGALA